ncbi:MAG: universal stress protein [Gammaproteobacteria bacterium]|jgi:nucleotide-binding universal stress UspA family protein|nr:universal stress protein [Gammaproteobacteria bacterium]
MEKVLIPVDGSEPALRAVRYAAQLCKRTCPLEIHLLSVEPAPQDWQTRGIGTKAIEEHLRLLAHEAAASAREILDAEGVGHTSHVRLGDPADTIARTTEELGCSHIIMGTRGLGKVAGLALGSVATAVLHLATVPVTFVK